MTLGFAIHPEARAEFVADVAWYDGRGVVSACGSREPCGQRSTQRSIRRSRGRSGRAGNTLSPIARPPLHVSAPTRVVACCATQPTISAAALSCASSSAAEISGCSAAASDEVSGSLTVTSTNRSAFGSLRRRPLCLARLDVDPGNPLLVGVTGRGPSTLDNVGSGGESLSDAGALGRVVVISPGSITLDVGPDGLRPGRTSHRHAPDHPLNDVRRQPTDPRNAAWAARARAAHPCPS